MIDYACTTNVVGLMVCSIVWFGVAMYERRRANKWMDRWKKTSDDLMDYHVAVMIMNEARKTKEESNFERD